MNHPVPDYTFHVSRALDLLDDGREQRQRRQRSLLNTMMREALSNGKTSITVENPTPFMRDAAQAWTQAGWEVEERQAGDGLPRRIEIRIPHELLHR